MNIDGHTLLTKDHPDLKIKMLNWADRFNIFCFLDGSAASSAGEGFECLLAAGAVRSYSFTNKDAFRELQLFFDEAPSYLFGHLGYNAVGSAYATSAREEIDFGRGYFFEPQILLRLSAEKIEVVKSNIAAELLLQEIAATPGDLPAASSSADIKASLTREAYIKHFESLKAHIQRGDCYEVNYCRQFTAMEILIDPIAMYERLSKESPAPFAALYKLEDHYCISASPERFLKKAGVRLISQPIKGTARRNLLDKKKDAQIARTLAASEKERAENVMITDLVRNDLSIVSEKASVEVTELFGVHSFPQVHHLISTIESNLRADKSFTDALAACFPPGSMTGAPKKRVMEIIEAEEPFQRGLFSGSVGYISPAGDFDFNVVIRSIFLNKKKGLLSLFAGGGITSQSEAKAEYDECNAKAEAIIRVLTNAF